MTIKKTHVMNYQEGIEHMQNIISGLEPNTTDSFNVGNLTITYPGKKKKGDYRLTINGVPPTHTDIVRTIYNYTTSANFDQVVEFLDDVYKNGLNATSTLFPRSFIEKLFWITLQEEINYPSPQYQGRKLPFCRFYEGALSKISSVNLLNVLNRTNNHGSRVPNLYKTGSILRPSFYN